MRQVVCLAAEPWGSVPTRTQQIMSRMKDAHVLFFEPPGPRGDKRWREAGRKLRPGLLAFTLPPQVTSTAAPEFLTGMALRRTLRYMRDRMSALRFRNPVLWCATPAAARLLDGLSYQGLVYDCYRGRSRSQQAWEEELAAAADVVFAASPQLARRMMTYNPNVSLLPSGCNYPMFARDGLPLPVPLSGIRGPILGFAGTLWPDLDLTPLVHLAAARPRYAVVLVGRNMGNRTLPQLLRYPNVRYTGLVETVDLPDYLCNFHVCLQLLRRSELGKDIIHARMFECLSTGRPIVAMLCPDQVEHFPDVVYGAHSSAEFVRLCDRALEERGDYARDRRRAYGHANSWASRAEEVNRILEDIGLFH